MITPMKPSSSPMIANIKSVVSSGRCPYLLIPLPRPLPKSPGILVEIDSMHDGKYQDGLKVYALIDVCTRWAQAKPVKKVNSWQSTRFIMDVRQTAPFSFKTIQTDHGSEFAKWFSKKLIAENLSNQEIADELYISITTVKTHVRNILLKLEAKNRIEAVVKAKEKGLLL